jgi:hypothetical protein
MADLNYLLNPSLSLQSTIQVRGLDPNARDPHDYLKMVSKTFNSFKENNYNNATTSYIHGFEAEYLLINEGDVKNYLSNEDLKYIDTTKKYHLIKINNGACFIDNQYIEFSLPIIFLYEFPTEDMPITLVDDLTNPAFENQDIKLFKNKKYKIVIEYKWLNQLPAQKARVMILPDEATYDNTLLPSLKIATFQIDSNGNLIKNNPVQDSNTNITNDYLIEHNLVQVDTNNNIEYYERGIDPQYLSKLYMDNYTKLFKNMQTQMFTIFNDSGMAQSNFTLIPISKLSSGLQSGTMIYYNPKSEYFEPAMSSRQKTDKVIGLYLHDIINEQHLLFFNGLVDLDPDNILFEMDYRQYKEIDGVLKKQTFSNRYGLTFNHPLVNLEVGNYYYLEDDSRYFTSSLLTYNLEDYIEWDTRGFISTRKFPGSVKVGYATDRTKLLINIDQSNEIDWDHATDLYGNHLLFNEEYTNVMNFYKYKDLLLNINKKIEQLNTDNFRIETYLGYGKNILDLENYNNVTKDINNVIKIWDPGFTNTNIILPDYLQFVKWFSDLLINKKFDTININTITLDNSLSLISNLTPLQYEVNSITTYFEEEFCKDDINYINLVKNSVTNLYEFKKINDIFINQLSNSIVILNNTKTNLKSIYNSKANNINTNEYTYTLKKYLLDLGDDVDGLDVFEDATKNIIKDLGIKYTDEKNNLIDYNTNATLNNTPVNETTLANYNNIVQLKNDLEIINLIIQKIDKEIIEFKYFKEILTTKSTLLSKYHLYFENKLIEINKELAQLTINSNEYIKLQAEANNKRNKYTPLALDIFYLNNYERKRYNYTYLVDRLKYEYSLQDSLNADKIVITSKLQGLRSSNATLYDIKLEELNLARIESRISKNINNIQNYVEEINLLHKEFNRDLIVNGDKNFNYEMDLINEDPNNFKFGVDFGPIGTNNERYLINEAFLYICNNLLFKLKNNYIDVYSIPNRLKPSIYTLDGSGLIPTDFTKDAFSPINFDINSIPTEADPYFIINIESNDTICYILDNKNYIFNTDDILPNGFPEINFNTIHKKITNTNGNIIGINKRFVEDGSNGDSTELYEEYFVYQDKTKTFIRLKPEFLNSEEITRFIREARVKSISEDLNNLITYTNFISYFLNKEDILNNTDLLNDYINEINTLEINDYSTQLQSTLPVINIKFTGLIEKVDNYYNLFTINNNKFNELIGLKTLCGLYNNLSDNLNEPNYISDYMLLKYNLTSEFRNESKEVRVNKITKILDFYASLLITNKNDIVSEIKKYRDITILGLIELNNVLNT